MRGSIWHLWCPAHGDFWNTSRYARCHCGYQTHPEKALPRHPSSERFHQILAELGRLHDQKQADYGLPDDPFANVRASSEWGVKPWVGAMIRLNDKVKRLQKAAAGGTLANEGVIDSLNDISVYAAIARVLYEEENGVKS